MSLLSIRSVCCWSLIVSLVRAFCRWLRLISSARCICCWLSLLWLARSFYWWFILLLLAQEVISDPIWLMDVKSEETLLWFFKVGFVDIHCLRCCEWLIVKFMSIPFSLKNSLSSRCKLGLSCWISSHGSQVASSGGRFPIV